MASVHPRRNKAGEVTAYLVKWRTGGLRTGAQQTERFDPDDEGREAAEVFKDAVNEAGQEWPLGWVKGQGLADDSDQYRFSRYAVESVRTRSGVEERYRDACLGELDRYLLPAFANYDVRSTEHFSRRAVQAWVNQLAQTEVRRGSKTKLMSPKTIRNLHGLLSSILQEAVEEDPPLRDRNPCRGVRLPRTDDQGTSGDDLGEDMEFLEPDEVAGIASRMRTAQGRRLVEDLYATGLRWGEVSALAGFHLLLTDPARPAVKVTRAFKWARSRGFYLGPPKTQRSRRTLRIPDSTLTNMLEQGAQERPNELIYHNGRGERLPYSTFWEEWMRAVREAKACGLLPEHKNPTVHDLRHSHASLLLSRGRGLTYVQRRLGHESIVTTSDRYGHLLPEADDEAMTAIEQSLNRGPAPVSGAGAAVPVPRAGKAGDVVHVVILGGGRQEAFWRADFARLVAEVWRLERRQETRVEERSAALWAARHGGLDGVHDTMPGRVELWELGPVLYGEDGEEQASATDVHALRPRWVWQWEDGFTTEAALSRAEHRPGPVALTEAYAWGVDQLAVVRAHVNARARALRMCGRHPAVLPAGGGSS